MTRKMGVRWKLRDLMARQGLFQTADLQPLLAEHGVLLSREQVWRLVTQEPVRVQLDTLAALCDILQCRLDDLIEVYEARAQLKRPKAVGEQERKQALKALNPIPARITPPQGRRKTRP